MSIGAKATLLCKLSGMKAMAICSFALGQGTPASVPLSQMGVRMDKVRERQTKPIPPLSSKSSVMEIGSRLTGSTAQEAASRQTVEYMRKIGLQQVHTEGWALSRGWQRGPAAARLVTPFEIPIPIAAYGWTGSTPAHQWG